MTTHIIRKACDRVRGTAGAMPVIWIALINAAGASDVSLDAVSTYVVPTRYQVKIVPDINELKFDGEVRIQFDLQAATDTIVLHAADLSISSASIDDIGRATVEHHASEQETVLAFTRKIAPGPHVLNVSYSGPINSDTRGVFHADYQSGSETTGRMLATMLCCGAEARRVAPMWDTPSLKAVFDLELVIPDDMQAVSNMPIASSERLGNGLKKVRFAQTPRMSTYLLFFAVGKFDWITDRLGQTEIRVYTEPGKAAQGHFALEQVRKLLGYYEDFFSIPYALPKLDNVALPGSVDFGAMENWGSVLYHESYLLLDPSLTTERQRQFVHLVIAHEVAHQWFGNLVSMAGWGDMWLNEGFAAWMENKATDHFHPEWKVWVQFALNRERAIRIDARNVTHPIAQEGLTAEGLAGTFNEITYDKSRSILRMLESYVGERDFRSGMTAYLRKYAFDNATTSDLWSSLQSVTAVPVVEVARDFIEQSGVPLIRVHSIECNGEMSEISLSQHRFGLDAVSRKPRTWRVPVTAQLAGAKHISHLIVKGAQPVKLSVTGCGAVKFNIGDAGYYRTLYDRSSLKKLRDAFHELPDSDQVGLLNDLYGLGEAGYISLESYFEFVELVQPAEDPVVVLQLVNTFRRLGRLYAGSAHGEMFSGYVRRLLRPVLDQVGWEDDEDAADDHAGILREELVELLAQVGDRDTITEARRRFMSANRRGVPIAPGTRKATLNAVGYSADIGAYQRLIENAERASSTLEQRAYFLAAARAQNPSIAQEALELTFSDQMPADLIPEMLKIIATQHPDRVYEAVTSRYSDIESRLTEYQRVHLVPEIAGFSNDLARADQLSEFAKRQMPTSSKGAVQNARSLIRLHDEVRRKRLPAVGAWLQDNTLD